MWRFFCSFRSSLSQPNLPCISFQLNAHSAIQLELLMSFGFETICIFQGQYLAGGGGDRIDSTMLYHCRTHVFDHYHPFWVTWSMANRKCTNDCFVEINSCGIQSVSVTPSMYQWRFDETIEANFDRMSSLRTFKSAEKQCDMANRVAYHVAVDANFGATQKRFPDAMVVDGRQQTVRASAAQFNLMKC